MIRLRPAAARGGADLGWLRTRYSFSFADYHDPAQMGFRSLRVINEDHVAPGTGFPPHAHRDMEILTWVLEGAVEHRDSLGHRSVVRAGEIQRMTAGAGIRHSEANPSPDESLHLLQIWILPDRQGLAPSYEQRAIDWPREDSAGSAPVPHVLVASPGGRDGSLRIHQDMELWAVRLGPLCAAHYPLVSGRGAWLQVARGAASLNGHPLAAGDGAAAEDETGLALQAGPEGAEILLFDLA